MMTNTTYQAPNDDQKEIIWMNPVIFLNKLVKSSINKKFAKCNFISLIKDGFYKPAILFVIFIL